MLNEHINTGQQPALHLSHASPQTRAQQYRANNQEHIFAALALLLGPETDYHTRLRATRRLARQGAPLLPLLLTTLNNYPEITSPPWPWWPPQYEHCSRLLRLLCQAAQIQLETLLQHPVVSQPPGPVLWTSIIEAAELLPPVESEALFCKGLAAPWSTTRYAAAMALAKLMSKAPLQEATLDGLRLCQREEEPISVRLAASYTLLRNEEGSGLALLMKLLASDEAETRKAATFVLAAEPPLQLNMILREELIELLLLALQDQIGEISLHAARALSHVALPSTLPHLCSLLDASHTQAQIAALTALEEMADRKAMRRVIRQHALSTHVVPLLCSSVAEVRRQASYTLAAFGGEYVTAVLGTTLLNNEHPAHLEAIEGLRLLHGALRTRTRTNVVRWLLRALQQPQEEVQVTALDSLVYLTWQARARGYKKAHNEISTEILQDGTALRLLTCASAWVRQRTIELLSLVDSQPLDFQVQLIHLLYSDHDSGVRACIAYTLGQMAARWAIPDLIQTLLDPDEHVAETALNALGRLASPDDGVVVYVLSELANSGKTSTQPMHSLAQSAQALLNKWRKSGNKGLKGRQEPSSRG